MTQKINRKKLGIVILNTTFELSSVIAYLGIKLCETKDKSEVRF